MIPAELLKLVVQLIALGAEVAPQIRDAIKSHDALSDVEKAGLLAALEAAEGRVAAAVLRPKR